ncbi:phage/conjugal plasmid C-4 type zinc finger protein, TraR family [Klebsiella pneumoniae]|nr:hypothetical protein [Klebsiella pneumoniae]VAN91434.1 phage/conjugal plasmid C-4 type zinc finger protein, TraR family [Klebsiella pneumoniae]VAO65479.1 phage/conjugal plasmid C-4 type zinc finger protein, TraR family [Klebsiella pneumoniae]
MSAELIDQANELAERRLEMTIQNMRIPEHAHQPCGGIGYSLPRLRGRDTRSAPGTGGGMPALC